jgi:hypothetical protein
VNGNGWSELEYWPLAAVDGGARAQDLLAIVKRVLSDPAQTLELGMYILSATIQILASWCLPNGGYWPD